MAEREIVRLDEGGANRRILAKQASADYRRVEQASLKQRTNLHSPEAKRLFARYFHSLQLNAHFVGDIARVHLAQQDVEAVEEIIRKRLERLMSELNDAMEHASALFAANAVTRVATYDTVVLDIEVGVISSFGRRYLEAIQALDRLMPMLRTLEIYEVILPAEVDRRRTLYKKSVRKVANAVRELATGLRRRINELARRTDIDRVPGVINGDSLGEASEADKMLAADDREPATSGQQLADTAKHRLRVEVVSTSETAASEAE